MLGQFKLKLFLSLCCVSISVQAAQQDHPTTARAAVKDGSSFVSRHPVAVSMFAALAIGTSVLIGKERKLRLQEGVGSHAFPGLATVLTSHLTPYLVGPLSGFATRLVVRSASALDESKKIKSQAEDVRNHAAAVHAAATAHATELECVTKTANVLKLQRVPTVKSKVEANGVKLGKFGSELQANQQLTAVRLSALAGSISAFQVELSHRTDQQARLWTAISTQRNLLVQLSAINQDNCARSQELSGQIRAGLNLFRGHPR